MAEPILRATWGFRRLYVGLAALLIFLRILPLHTAPTLWPGPDLLLCITFAWVLRRPEYVPAPLIALVFLMEDLVLMRPPGLWTVIVLLTAEFLREREAFTRELTFATEWAMVAGAVFTTLLGYRFVFLLTFLPEPPLVLSVLQAGATILAYPLVVVASALAFGLRKAATGELDALGRRL